ncbi:MAG: TetR/AcrR family transcriptional regulator [Ktedonobacteraceae bacterium]|nr:TetR/AcrR family transcriptional regulator [Ktedonobacteraceae bacterium]
MSNQKYRAMPEASRETRARIIAAAYKVLAEKGYEATTLREISKAADAAPGLVHYYFGGKDQLLVEVLKEVGERHTQMPEQLVQATDAPDPLQMVLQQPIDQIIETPEWYRLRHELFALGLHNTLMAPKVRDLLAEGRENIAMSIKNVLGETTIEPQVLATLLLAFFDGLALQKIMDPDLDVSGFADVLATILRSFEKKFD